MTKLFKTKIGLLRILCFLEGSSLILLVFLAVPFKHLYGNPFLVKTIGPIHGLFFLLFILNTLSISIEEKWVFKELTWKVLLACIIPFGTFYIDKKLLSKLN